MVARGYRGFQSPDLQDGWFRTSDAGSLIDDHLTVHGRIDNIIDSGGLKLHPEVLETFLLKVEGVTGACVVGKQDARFGERICAAYTGSATVADIMNAFDDAEDAGEIARWQVPKEIKVVPALPQLGPGKVDRVAVRELF